VAGLGVVDAEAVEEDEGLLEGGAAEGEVGLNAVGGASLEVEGGVLTEEIDYGVGDEGLIAWVDEIDGAVAFGEGEWFKRSGDCDALCCDAFGWEGGVWRERILRGLSVQSQSRAQEAEEEMFS
jgi:hypothetical protein